MQPAQQSLKTAYNRAKLADHGISFDEAMERSEFKICLTRIAEAIEKPYVPLPTHACKPHWQDRDS
jgi:hypothetical protein